MDPRITAIVLNWNGLQDTLASVRSLLDQAYPALRVVVVDNGSDADEATVLRDAFAVRGVTVVANPENAGFGIACNRVMEQELRGEAPEYVFLFNNDATLEAGALLRLANVMEASPRAAIASPRVLVSGTATPWYAGASMSFWRGGTKHATADDGGTEVRSVPFAPACAVLVRASALREIGLFDERYFAYFEDADLCLRARQRGWEVLYVPEAVAQHRVSASSGEGSAFRTYLFARNRVWFMRQHARPYHWLTFLPLQFIAKPLGAVAMALAGRRSFAFVRAYLRGLRDGLLTSGG